MRARLVAGLVVVALGAPLSACGGDEAGPTVTVVRGVELAPPELQRSVDPAARYLEESRVVVFVSAALYSGTCSPKAAAEQDGVTVTITVDDGHDGVCTADAGRVLFLAQGFDAVPKRLLVRQDGQPDIALEVAP